MSHLPVHRRPSSCYVCGTAAATDTGRPACAHDYTNAEAEAEVREHDRRVLAAGGPVYSDGTRNAEANYVNQHRPY